MRQARRITTIAVLEAIFGIYLGYPYGAPLLWAAAATGVVAIAVYAGRPGLLGKSASGRIPWWSFVLFFPWHVATQLVARLHRRTHPPAITEVHPGWFVGGWPRPGDVPPGTAIVDMTAELWTRMDGPYLCVPAWDGTAPDIAGLERAVQWALAQHDHGPVLFHCAHGRGRSVMALLATLVAEGRFETWEAAFEDVRARRFVRLSSTQRALLEAWQAARDGEDRNAGGGTSVGLMVAGFEETR